MDQPAATAAPALAEAIGDQFFSPIVTEMNARVKEVFDSQAALSEQLAAMSVLLERFLSESPQAPNLSDKISRLGEAKERMARVNATLDKIQTRLDRLHDEHKPRTSPAPKKLE